LQELAPHLAHVTRDQFHDCFASTVWT
jgi:hypothetical protein